MTRADDRELLRRMAGDRLPGEATGRLAAAGGDAGGAAEHDRLAALWASLEPPAAGPAPPGFAGRVMARVREAGGREAGRRGETLARRFGVVPARLAAGSALAAGLVAGVGLGAVVATPGGEAERRPAPAVAAVAGELAPGAGGDAFDDESLVAAAVAAAGAGWAAGEVSAAAADTSPAESDTAESDLADGYLAALGALAEAS